MIALFMLYPFLFYSELIDISTGEDSLRVSGFKVSGKKNKEDPFTSFNERL